MSNPIRKPINTILNVCRPWKARDFGKPLPSDLDHERKKLQAERKPSKDVRA